MRNTFCREKTARKELARFVREAPRLSMGAKCSEFEAAFGKFQGRKHAILFNSGASANLALLQALRNLGRLKAADKVGFSALTWSTNVMPILQMDMAPVPVDCAPATLNVMASNFQERLGQTGMKALFITNALGFAGDLDNIRDLAKRRGVLLLEDNCEALGTELPRGRAGNFGLASTFSFYVGHHMSTIEGGMVCTDDDALAEMLRIARANGWDRNLNPIQQARLRKNYRLTDEFQSKYTFYDLGFNLRPTEITGFLGLNQLPFVASNCKKRESNYARIERVIRGNSDLSLLDHSHLSLFSNFAIPVLCNNPKLRDEYLARFARADIEVRPMIAGNIQRQPFYAKYVKTRYALPGADFVHRCGFYCGNYPDMTTEELATIENCLAKPRRGHS